MIDAYLGSLDNGRLAGFEGLERDDQTNDIISQYKAINKRFPVSEADDAALQELFDELKAIGFFGLSIPARYGGLGLNIRQYLKIVEIIAAENMSLGFTALAHLSIGAKGIVLFGTEAQKERYLVPAATGDMIFSYALTEPKTGSDAQHIQTTAALSEDGRHYTLNGQKNIHHQRKLRWRSNRLCADGSEAARSHGRLCCRNRLGGRKDRQGYAQDGTEIEFHRRSRAEERPGSQRKLAGTTG
jgi:hypothetical protein